MAAYFNLNNNEMRRTSMKDCFYDEFGLYKTSSECKVFFKHNNFVRSNAVMYKKIYTNLKTLFLNL